MRPPAPWSRRFWRLPAPPQNLALPAQEQFGRDEVHRAGYVFSPGGHEPPPGVKPGWDWPDTGLGERQDRAPGWVLWWLHLPFFDRWAHVWMWRHACYEVEPPIEGPEMPPGPDAGVREPRRPPPSTDLTEAARRHANDGGDQ
jgi:hypothetical protein